MSRYIMATSGINIVFYYSCNTLYVQACAQGEPSRLEICWGTLEIKRWNIQCVQAPE